MKNKKPVAKKATKKTAKAVAKKPTKKKKPVKKNDNLVVHSPVNPTQEFVVASELADDSAIEADLLGKAMEHYVYSFEQKGKPVTGLTVAGVNEMSRLLTRKKDSGIKIRIVPDSVKIERDVEENGQKGVSVILMAENMLTGESAIGAKFEAYKKTGHKGDYDNTFPLEKAVSKAERNAKRKLIPEKVAVEMIKKFTLQGKVQSLPQARPVAKVIEAPKPKAIGVNYLSKLISMLAKETNIEINNGSLTKAQAEIMIETYNAYTGQNIKSLKVAQSTAQKYLMDFVNSPALIK
jgi:hypothetical protein